MSRTIDHFRPLPPARLVLLSTSMLMGAVLYCWVYGSSAF